MAVLWPFFGMLCLGCGDASAIRPTDVRQYVAPAPARPITPKVSEDSPARLRLRYDTPDGWSDGGVSGGMRLATLLIGDPSAAREVTVIPASGSLRDNVARWQGQLDAQADPDAASKAVARALERAESLDVDGVTATIVLLEGPETDGAGEAILGAVIPLDDVQSLFVKFRGDATVVAAQKDSFRRFVQSIRWK